MVEAKRLLGSPVRMSVRQLDRVELRGEILATDMYLAVSV